MKKVKRIISVCLIACFVLATGGCSKEQVNTKDEISSQKTDETKETKDVRVTWWGSQARHNSTIEALDSYAAKNNITFSYEYTSWDSYWETLATQAVGNNMPDVLQMSTTDIVNYSNNGQIISLQPYIDSGIIDLTYVDENSLKAGTVENEVTGYPTGVNTVSVVYNKDIFDQAGVAYPENNWTWSEFIDTAQKIYDTTGIQTDIPFLSEARWVVEFIVRCYGYDYYGANGTFEWANDEKVINGLKKAFEDIHAMVESGVFIDPEVQIAWSTTEDNYIVQGKSAMAFLLSNYYETYSDVLGKALGICMLPKMDDGVKSGMYMNANMYWVISTDCKDPEEAAKVINYLVNDMVAMDLILADRGISLSSDIRAQLANTVGEYTSNTFNYVSQVSEVVEKTNTPDPVNASEITNILKANYHALAYGEMTVEDCINDFTSQAETILAQ